VVRDAERGRRPGAANRRFTRFARSSDHVRRPILV
jgi:hypothetical protein